MIEARPSATVTFLFTDIEGSTRLLQTVGDRYAAILAAQRQLLRSVSHEHGGHEVDTPGDAGFFAFPSAREAVGAAVAAQQALRDHQWPEGASVLVRMGLHTGEALAVGSGYVGIDVHRAARVAAAAHGGQILLSEATRALVQDDLPGGAVLRDLGAYRLKDLTRPQHLYQVSVPALPQDFPPPSSLAVVPHNLPVQLTSFIGREREKAEVTTALVHGRLVTLTGSGGAGKTRLALQVAAEVMDAFPDGVWVIELASLADPMLVASVAASVLGVREQPGRTPREALAEFIRSRSMLVLMDNCEHLVGSCADLADTLLRSSPGLRILATSREVLGVPGEILYPVPPLTYPESQGERSAETAASFESVALFVDRARMVQPSFSLTPDNVAAIAELCRRLDGIPLAIELAAAWVRAISVGQIATRLGDRFRLLTSAGRTGVPRHQTLQAALDWSHELLSEPERVLLRRTAVFAGGFTLEAVERVCAGDPVPAAQVVSLLSQVVDKSLVVAVTTEHEARYRLLETIRLYYLERLIAAGEQEQVQEAHFGLMRDLVQAAERQGGPTDRSRRDRVGEEHDNIRAALAWALKAGPVQALVVATALWRFWAARGHIAEGHRWLAMTLEAAPEAVGHVRAEALVGAGRLAMLQGDFSAAQTYLAASREIGERMGDVLAMASAIEQLGNVASRLNDHPAARRQFEEALQLYRQAGDTKGIGRVLADLGHGLWHEGELARARVLLEESLALSKTVRAPSWLVEILWTLGLIEQDSGDYATARARYASAIQAARDTRNFPYVAHLLEAFAGLAALEGRPERAARLLGAAEAFREALQYALPESHRRDIDRALALIRPAVAAGTLQAAWSEGRSMGREQAVEYALATVDTVGGSQ